MERRVRIRKEWEPARGTHVLESPDGKTSQDTDRMQSSERHPRTGEPRWRDKSGHGKNGSQQGALTNWRARTEGQARTPNLGETSMRAQAKKSVRIDILSVTAMQNSVLQLTQSDGKADMHIFITASVLTMPCLTWVLWRRYTLLIFVSAHIRTYRLMACFMLSSKLSLCTAISIMAITSSPSTLAVVSMRSAHRPCLCISGVQN